MDQKSNYEVSTNSRSCLSDKLCTFCSEESKEKRGYLKIRMQERSPSEGPTAEALQGSDSPNCKEDRRLQNKYEKFVLQTEALQKRIVELEAELKRCKYETPPDQENEEVCFPKDSLLIKMEDSRACLEGTQDGEVEQTQRTNTKHSKLFFEMEELKSKLKRTKKGKKEKS